MKLASASPTLLGQIALNGFLHFIYNQLSFIILGMITPLSHSILNAARRFVIIMGAVVYFASPLTTLNLIGTGLQFVVSSLLY